MNERKIGTYKLKKSLKIAFTPEYQPFIHAFITEKCESNFNTDMLFDWTGDFDFKREKKKMDEKTHQRQLFQGVGGCVEGGGGVEWV